MQNDHRADPHLSGSAALFAALRRLGAKKGLDLSGTLDAAGRLWIEAQGETPPPPLPPAQRGPKPKKLCHRPGGGTDAAAAAGPQGA